MHHFIASGPEFSAGAAHRPEHAVNYGVFIYGIFIKNAGFINPYPANLENTVSS